MVNSTNDNKLIGKIFAKKFKIDQKIGEGSFGKIFSCFNIYTNTKFAIKIESYKKDEDLLDHEALVLSEVQGEGIPKFVHFENSGQTNILIMELLGKSLDDLFNMHNCKFSLKTVCMIGIEMLKRIQLMHEKHYIHRDIKPDNFVVGLENNKKMIYLIDFGLSKKFRNKRLQHNPIKNNKKLTGTARYASINALKGLEQSRRDDLESIGYCLVYFLKGKLPWQGLQVNDDEDKYEKIYEKKKSVTSKILCLGLPSELYEFVEYTRNLNYEQDPNYDYLKRLLGSIISFNKWELDYNYDWVESKHFNAFSSTNVLFKLRLKEDEDKINEENNILPLFKKKKEKLNTMILKDINIMTEEFAKLTKPRVSNFKEDKNNFGVSIMVAQSERGLNNESKKELIIDEELPEVR